MQLPCLRQPLGSAALSASLFARLLPAAASLRSGTPLRGYPSHVASLVGPSRSRSRGRLRRPEACRHPAGRCALSAGSFRLIYRAMGTKEPVIVPASLSFALPDTNKRVFEPGIVLYSKSQHFGPRQRLASYGSATTNPKQLPAASCASSANSGNARRVSRSSVWSGNARRASRAVGLELGEARGSVAAAPRGRATAVPFTRRSLDSLAKCCTRLPLLFALPRRVCSHPLRDRHRTWDGSPHIHSSISRCTFAPVLPSVADSLQRFSRNPRYSPCLDCTFAPVLPSVADSLQRFGGNPAIRPVWAAPLHLRSPVCPFSCKGAK